MMCTARSNVCLAVFCFYPVSNSPEGDNKAGQFQLHQVDFCTVVKVELVMRNYNSSTANLQNLMESGTSERSNINHGTR